MIYIRHFCRGFALSFFRGLNMTIQTNDRAHLLGLLRIKLNLMKKEKFSTNEIYRSLEDWIANREQVAVNKERKNG
ncbi:hypothetical protein AWI36_18895 [Enterobacter hormaechei subsp. steigerwaltii]|nr:hypothetical protein AWI36_18895 [Enterobacter hormaechei subsp. steigerwaltii]